MKHNGSILVVITSLLLLLGACKKGDNENLDDENDPNASFLSTKEGSWWLYGVSDGTVNKRKATSRDSTMLDRTYNYYELEDTVLHSIIPEYFAKNQEFMLMLADLDGTKSNYAVVVIYKENGKVGDTWTNTGNFTFSGIPVQVKIEGRIESAGGSVTIAGKTYQDVTVTHNDLKAKITGTPAYTNCGTAKLWFAKGVGVLKSDYDIKIPAILTRKFTDSLLDHHIVP